MVTSAQVLIGTSLYILCLLIFGGCVYLYFRKRDTTPLAFADILANLNRVDLDGLRRMIDPKQEAALRRKHSRIEFSKIQQTRILAVEKQFRAMAANAKALQDIGYRNVGRNQPWPASARPRRCREQSEYEYLEDTKRLLAHRLINFAVPVKICCRASLFTLFLWRRLRILRRLLISFSLCDLKDLVEQTVEAYEEMKEAALMLARYSEQGVEVTLVAHL